MSNAVVDRFTALSAAFADRVDGTAPDRWASPAPCVGWTARDVVTHVTANVRRLTGGGEVGADEDAAAAFHAARSAAIDAMNVPGALEAVVPGPMGPMPLEQMVGRLLCNDILVHTWDLARATGQDEMLDADAVAHAYDGLKPLDAMIRMPGFFGPKVAAPDDADLQTQFLSFLGRAV